MQVELLLHPIVRVFVTDSLFVIDYDEAIGSLGLGLRELQVFPTLNSLGLFIDCRVRLSEAPTRNFLTPVERDYLGFPSRSGSVF